MHILLVLYVCNMNDGQNKKYALTMKAILTHLPMVQSLPKTCRLTITYSADTPAYRATTAKNMAVADDYANMPAY